MIQLITTLTGRTGTGIRLDLPGGVLAARRTIHPEVGPVVTTFCVGSTGDPSLTDAEWLLRDQEERAANPFRAKRACLVCGQTEGHAVSQEACRKAYLRTL